MLADFVVVSGYSGAGKSSAMNVFEDAGYFCVDNLPPAMIRSLAAMFTDDGGTVERACVVCDARGGEYFDELAAVLDELDAGAVPSRVLFLEADDQELLNRYKATRRRHPLARETNVADGVRRERAQLAPIRARADVVVDTTGLSPSALRRKLASEMSRPEFRDGSRSRSPPSATRTARRTTPTSSSTSVFCRTRTGRTICGR